MGHLKNMASHLKKETGEKAILRALRETRPQFAM